MNRRRAQYRVAIKESHHYDVPDIVAKPIEAGSAEYLAGLTFETRPE
ncbi:MULTISPECIES: divalent cation tolerance protein CutA [unclassified Amycolatopsis]|nr:MULTISPECIES: divalent cation tolerance protein CutA [unclassified Amycolatopsis]